jgi:hypothetical protein
MQILRTCADPACSTLGMGFFCIAHDHRETRTFVRGRPFTRAASTKAPAVALPSPRSTTPRRKALARTP